ncbi:MAG: AAA family ATPase [Phycisphaerales bacterium]|nr:MAG: AAA family ATPase [Phycisphaerales bacterium]
MAKSKLPPQDPEAEAAFLGGILFGERYGKPVDLDSVREVVSPEMFYAVPPHRHLFQAIVDATDQGGPIAAPSLLVRLRRADPNENWQEVVNNLDHQGDPANAVHYAGQIREAWRKRELLRVSHELAEQVNSNDPDLKAADVIEATYKRLRSIGTEQSSRGLVILNAEDIIEEQIDWWYEGRIALGMLNMVFGDPDLGKTRIVLDWIARKTRGVPFPDHRDMPNPASGALILTGEDSKSKTMIPRLRWSGADFSKIRFMDVVDADQGEELFSLDKPQHIQFLDRFLRANPWINLVLFDPLDSFMGKTDGYTGTEVRGILRPVVKMIENRNTAVIFVRHLNKQSLGSKAIYRATGSVAFIAASRTAWLVTLHPDDADDPGTARRIVTKAKGNIIPPSVKGMEFSLSPAPLPHSEYPADKDRFLVLWGSEPVTISADRALGSPNRAHKPRDHAEEFLLDRLAAGPVRAAELAAKDKEVGIRKKTLYRAKHELKVRHTYQERDGKRESWWFLDDTPTHN